MDNAHLEAVKLFATTVLPGEPKGYQDVITGADSVQWAQAMKHEIAVRKLDLSHLCFSLNFYFLMFLRNLPLCFFY